MSLARSLHLCGNMIATCSKSFVRVNVTRFSPIARHHSCLSSSLPLLPHRLDIARKVTIQRAWLSNSSVWHSGKQEAKLGTNEESSEKSSSSDNFDPDSDEERRQRGAKMARNTKWTAIGLLGLCSFYPLFFGWEFGKPIVDENGQIVDDGFGTSWSYERCLSRFTFYKSWFSEPSRDKLLPDPLPEPYIQPKYTLLIELTGVLVSPEWSYGTGWRFLKRAAVDHFLRKIGYPQMEVVIYTKESGMTADPIVQSLDPEGRIMYRLYRDTTKFDTTTGAVQKDLSRLNRDLKRVICIDWDPTAVSGNPENALLVPKWSGDLNDTSLVELAELLRVIVASDVEDVRPVLRHYAQFDDPAAQFRVASHQLSEVSLSAAEQAAAQKEKGLASKFSGKLFGVRRHSGA